MRKCSFFIMLLLMLLPNVQAQRTYKSASVLSSGYWYKIAIKETGIYKVDLAVLNKLGVNTSNLSSSAIRLFGNGGAMLPEACNGFKNDDLVENAIQVMDGGDGIFDGNDYFLFYATGPDRWLKDSLNKSFRHQKNLYSNKSYYFISIGGTGKQVQIQNGVLVPNTGVTSFSEHFFHELDSVNLLSGGKDWYGEELGSSAGAGSSKTFSIPITDINTIQPASIVSAYVARSINAGSKFTINVNGAVVLQQDIAAVGNTNLDLFARNALSAANFIPANSLSVTYNYSGGSGAQGWIDWFEIFCRRNLVFTGNGQLSFRDWNSVASTGIAKFNVQNAAAAQVWDVTNAAEPIKMNTAVNGSDLSFINNTSSLHEYIAFSTVFLAPEAVGKINNQNLHNSQPADLIIVAYPPFLQQAQRIATLHQQKDNLKTITVTTEQVYNEFSSGIADPSAIRDFVKMYYDKAGADSTLRPKYLLLFGDASFDYKDRVQHNTNYVPAYENNFSLDPLANYTSDDFFGFLDDNEDINSLLLTNLLDIGIGRIPAQTLDQAKAYADKLINYTDPKSLGVWRNEQIFIADDQDANLHLNDAEEITLAAAATNPLFIQNKIYLDAYTQTSTTAGSRYPEVNLAINDQVQNGTLIWNYNGHGSSTRLAEEVVLEKDIVDTWTNTYRLPLFITATCDFAPYDNPASASLGENILLREKTGAIALMTTTRLVFAFSNRIMNRNYLQAALQPGPDGTYLSLGEALRQAKNITYQTQSDITNNRKFTLLGDPALTLAFPKYRVQTETINGNAVTAIPDTLKALQKYDIGGSISDAQGIPITGFNGTLYATVFDKAQSISTKANDADSYQQNFQVQHNQLFKGRVNVVNGKFNFSFIVPKDINYQLGNGRISYYTDNGVLDGNGNFNGFLIGGSQGASNDNNGPLVYAYLNDETFINGSTVNQQPVLFLKLSDASGINIAGTGIGHDITAVLDGDTKKTYVLNSFFESDLDSYQKGGIRFQLPEMEEGEHTMVIKVWDVANNSSEVTIRFRLLKKEGLRIFDIINYPNPFKGSTSFRFGHNRPNSNLKVSIKVYSVNGRLVKTINETINSTGSRSSVINWDGTGESGVMLIPAVYIYQLQVTSAGGEIAFKAGKLILL